MIYLPTAYQDSVLQCWPAQASSCICRSGSACCPVVEPRQLVVSFFQRLFAESFMALRNFGPGLFNSYRAFSSSSTTAVLVHNLFPSFDCRSISLFWMISTSSSRSSAISLRLCFRRRSSGLTIEDNSAVNPPINAAARKNYPILILPVPSCCMFILKKEVAKFNGMKTKATIVSLAVC
jgi:hypothetical protein